MRQIVWLSAALVLAFASFDATDSIDAADKPAPQSIDAQLLDDLDADLLEGLPGNVKATPAEQQATPPSETSDPLAQIGERMRTVQQRIANGDTSDETRALQGQIQKELAALIEQAQKQCAACKAASGQTGQAGSSAASKPAPPRDSTNRIEKGTTEAAETTDVKEIVRRFWGHLPDKIRDQMQSSLSEEFLPQYQRLIEDYYKRLAEEGSVRP